MSPAESGAASSSNTENPESTPLHFVRCAHIGYLQVVSLLPFRATGAAYRSTGPFAPLPWRLQARAGGLNSQHERAADPDRSKFFSGFFSDPRKRSCGASGVAAYQA